MLSLLFPYANTRKGGEAKPLLSDERGLLTQPVGGKWQHAAKQGKIFTVNSAAAGIVLPIYSATAQLFGLWNPMGSNVNAWLLGIRGTYVDTTGAAGGFCLGLLKNAGAAVGTAAPISAFTEAQPECGLIRQGMPGNRVRCTGSAATVTTGLMIIGRQLGVNQLVLTAAEDEQVTFGFKEDFDGDIALAPGNALFLCGNIATLSKWAISMTWAEEEV